MVDPLFWRGSAFPPRVNGFPETIYDDLLLWDDGNSVSQDSVRPGSDAREPHPEIQRSEKDQVLPFRGLLVKKPTGSRVRKR